MSENIRTMYDAIDPALQSQAKLNEALDESQWDRSTKIRMRKEVNRLKGMIGEVMNFREDVPQDLIEGIEEVIVNAEAKLDGKPMHFKADETSFEQAA